MRWWRLTYAGCEWTAQHAEDFPKWSMHERHHEELLSDDVHQLIGALVMAENEHEAIVRVHHLMNVRDEEHRLCGVMEHDSLWGYDHGGG